MKSTDRHELRRNALLELLSNPRELFRRYGLSILIVAVTAVVAVYFIYRAAGAEERKWRGAWQPLDAAVNYRSEEQLKALADNTKTEPLIRAWAYVRLGELLYSKSQQPEYFNDSIGRNDLLQQAIKAYHVALIMSERWREVAGQATIGLGLCYEDLGQADLAIKQYDSIISQAEQRYAGTPWLFQAERRKAFLAKIPDENIIFAPEPPPSLPTDTGIKPPAEKPADTGAEPPAEKPSDTGTTPPAEKPADTQSKPSADEPAGAETKPLIDPTFGAEPVE